MTCKFWDLNWVVSGMFPFSPIGNPWQLPKVVKEFGGCYFLLLFGQFGFIKMIVSKNLVIFCNSLILLKFALLIGIMANGILFWSQSMISSSIQLPSPLMISYPLLVVQHHGFAPIWLYETKC